VRNRHRKRRGKRKSPLKSTNWNPEPKPWPGRSSRPRPKLTAQLDEYGLMKHGFLRWKKWSCGEATTPRSAKILSTRTPRRGSSGADVGGSIETDPTLEAAVEDYSMSRCSTFWVDQMDDALSSVEKLRRIGAGKCTFMTLHNGHALEQNKPGFFDRRRHSGISRRIAAHG